MFDDAIALEVVKHHEAKNGFVLVPRRRLVERSFAWATRSGRLVEDHERPSETLVGLHFAALARLPRHRGPRARIQNPP